MSRTLRPFAVLALLASPLLASCSKSSTILALTINTPTDKVAMVDSFNVSVKPTSGAAENYTISGAPHSNDAGIAKSFFDRRELNVSGPSVISVEAIFGGQPVASGKTDDSLPVDIVEHEATAVTINLAPPSSTNPGTGGMSGGTGGAAGGAGGAGGEAAGGSGGAAGGAAGGAKGGSAGGAAGGAKGGNGGRNGGAGGA